MNIRLILAMMLTLSCASLGWAGPRGAAGDGEHRRLRGDLEGYSREAYPDRERVEARRQVMRERMQQRLREADRDRDGAISRDEAGRDMPGLARHFDRIDEDGDGGITREEMKNARERLREMRRRDRDANAE